MKVGKVLPVGMTAENTSYPQSRKEHERHLRTVLRVLQERELYAKLPKSEFWMSEVAF